MSIGRFWYLFEDGFNPQTTSIQEWHLLTPSVEEKGFSIGWHINANERPYITQLAGFLSMVC